MKEDEAKTKWCPFARTTELWPDGCSNPRNRVVTVKPDEGEAITIIGDLAGTKCLGSSCMAWRKEKEYVPPPKAKGFDPIGYERDNETSGYCGMAGKP